MKPTDENSDKTEQAESTDIEPSEIEETVLNEGEEVFDQELLDDSTTDAALPSEKKRGGMIAWLALLVSLLALAGSGLSFVKNMGSADDEAESSAALAELGATGQATRDSVETLQQNITTLTDDLAANDSEINALSRQLKQQLEDRLRRVESLPARVVTIENALSTLQGVSTGARDGWLLAEAEYYMQIANAQLQLAGNPHIATLALELADERILQLANPALADVRRALSDELRALEVMEKPDTEGVTLTLASLAGVVDSLPLKREFEVPSADAAAAADAELTGGARALATLKSAMSAAISVRRSDEAVKPLMAPEAQYFLRANLALQLQAARLAVLRGEESIFQNSLDDASEWLAEYYDLESAPVKSAQQTIGDIRQSVFSVAAPDISESLRLLRQFNTLSGAEDESTRVPEPRLEEQQLEEQPLEERQPDEEPEQ